MSKVAGIQIMKSINQMKGLFLIILITLTSISASYSQRQRTYVYPNGNKYVGSMKNGYPHGQGTLYYGSNSFLGRNGYLRYVGNWSDGSKYGQGTIFYKSGKRCESTWGNEGNQNGQEICYYPNGNRLVRTWKYGNIDGKETLYYANGDKRTRFWKNNRTFRKGTYYFKNGEKYIGSWSENGKYDGDGVLYDKEGNKSYEGQWNNGLYHGQGTEYFTNGKARYKGSWENNSRNGQGIQYDPDGNVVFEGSWKDGAQYNCTYHENDEYQGKYVAGVYHPKQENIQVPVYAPNSPKTEERRIALVIGNATYSGKNRLKNPVNDANLMAKTLENLGFTVIKKVNTTKVELEKAIYEYVQKLKDHNVALFYYAGHGIEVDGKNYLIPIDAILKSKTAVRYETVAVNYVVDEFENYKSNTNIVILDACRDNPFLSKGTDGSRGFISTSSGFKSIPPASGTIIAFATSAGEKALDGENDTNGVYTKHLVKQLNTAQSIESVFKKTRIAVEKASNGAQSPQEWTKLTGNFWFKHK